MIWPPPSADPTHLPVAPHLAAIVQNLKTLALRILGPPPQTTPAWSASVA